MTILESILADKKAEVEESKKRIPLREMAERSRTAQPPRLFKKALQETTFALIAEIKKASPSRGTLVEDFDHRLLAAEFERGGANALSVLTEQKYFGGDPAYIQQVKEVSRLPVLRKDFIVDEYQVYESRVLGADAILLIARALPEAILKTLMDLAESIDMDVLVETQSREEIQTAQTAGAQMIGINNRDLATFQVDLETSLRLREFVGMILSQSARAVFIRAAT